MNRRVAIIGAVAVVPLVVVLAMALKFDPAYMASPLIGKPAPAFRLVDLNGQTVDLHELRGQPVVLNFWSTWCAPCITEHPWLQAAARQYQGRAHFLGIIYQDDPEKIRRFNNQRGAWGPSLIDPDGKVAIAYGIYGPPESFIIDADGIVVEKVIGAVEPRALAAQLERLTS